MSRAIHLLVVGAMALAGCARESDETEVPIGKSLSSLPAHVTAAEGTLSLFADFSAKTDNGVPIYVVNRTRKTVKFHAQDGDIFIKLEYEAKRGQWARAEPHEHSACGNSYFKRPVLAANSYAVVNGHVGKEGAEATVRYSIYNQEFKLSSNEGVGLVNEKEIKRAGIDVMAVYSADFEFVRRVALGEVPFEHGLGSNDPRAAAIQRLAGPDFPRAEADKVLTTVATGPDSEYADQAAEVLGRRGFGHP